MATADQVNLAQQAHYDAAASGPYPGDGQTSADDISGNTLLDHLRGGDGYGS